MIKEIKYLGYTVLTIFILSIYFNSFIAYDVDEKMCYVINRNDNCFLELLNQKKCLSDVIGSYRCKMYENMQVINCYVRMQKYFNLCKIYLSLYDLHQDFGNYSLMN